MNRSPFSSDSPRESECREYARLLGAYIDGELDAAKLLEIEGHVASCEGCRERVELDRAMRGTLKKLVKEPCLVNQATNQGAPRDAMRARMAAAMTAERARGDAREAANTRGDRVAAMFGWKTMLPLTSAAALAVIWGSVQHSSTRTPSHFEAAQAGMVEDPLAELVWNHAQPLPPERTDEQGVRAFERYVGVPVRPSQFERGGAHLVGARLLPVRHEHAAMLEYRVGQGASAQRVSVFIYDPRKIQVGGPDLTPRSVGTSQVRVGRNGGYSVAVTQHGGVGYTLASDIDQDQLAAYADTE